MLRARTVALSRTITALRLKQVTLLLDQGHVVSSSPNAHQHHIINSSPDVNRFIACSHLHSSQTNKTNNIDCPTTILTDPGADSESVVCSQDISVKPAGEETSVDGVLEENVTSEGKKMVSYRRIVQEPISPPIGDESPEQLVDTQEETTDNPDEDHILWRNFEASRAYMHGTAVGRGLFSI